MTLRRTVAVLAVLTTSLAGCATASDDKPTIVVTTNILGDVVENLVGDEADVTTLMAPNADPHSFEISARQAAGILDADLLVTNGLGLEERLQHHVDRAMADDVPTFVAGEHIDVLTYSGEGTGDPHFWTDPGRMIDVVDALEPSLAKIDGIDTDTVTARVDSYRRQLEQLESDMGEAFRKLGKDRRYLVTNHHVFGYLADRFDFTIIGAVIPSGSTLAAPSAADLRELASAIDEAGVRVIFAESSQPDRLVRVLADEADTEVEVTELFTESLTEQGGGAENYLQMMRANTERIATGLAA